MRPNVFVSYKHHDNSVQPLNPSQQGEFLTREYVDHFEKLFGSKVYSRAEDGDNDLSALSDDSVEKHLKDLIYPTTITFLFASPEMKESIPEKDQWISWEISYSLKEIERLDRTSRSNAVVVVALPDKAGTYDHVFKDLPCNVREIQTNRMFEIVKNNFFNLEARKPGNCGLCNHTTYPNSASYFILTSWESLIENENALDNILETASQRLNDRDAYDICKQVK